MKETSASTLPLSLASTRRIAGDDRRITLVKCFNNSSLFLTPRHSTSCELADALLMNRSILWRRERLVCGKRRVHSFRASITPGLSLARRPVCVCVCVCEEGARLRHLSQTQHAEWSTYIYTGLIWYPWKPRGLWALCPVPLDYSAVTQYTL